MFFAYFWMRYLYRIILELLAPWVEKVKMGTNKKAPKSTTKSWFKRKPNISRWWLNQPSWKICPSNWMISPGIGVNIKKYLKPPPRYCTKWGKGKNHRLNVVQCWGVFGQLHGDTVSSWTTRKTSDLNPPWWWSTDYRPCLLKQTSPWPFL